MTLNISIQSATFHRVFIISGILIAIQLLHTRTDFLLIFKVDTQGEYST